MKGNKLLFITAWIVLAASILLLLIQIPLTANIIILLLILGSILMSIDVFQKRNKLNIIGLFLSLLLLAAMIFLNYIYNNMR